MAISSKPQIEAIQSVTSIKMTDPRVTRRVIPGPEGFRRSFNTVLYFKGAEGCPSPRVSVGLIKESLGRALAEHPLLGGRIRKADEGGFEIFSNDSGARLIEARVRAGLDTYLESEERDRADAELVQWKDIDKEDPQYSPLLYIQVTNFECGGFSVGISCSLLMADPLAITSFLKRLETIHSNLFAEENASATAFRSLFNLHCPYEYPSSPYGLNPNPKTAKTVVFKAEGWGPDSAYGPLVLLCTVEAEAQLKCQMGPIFSVLVKEKDPSGATEVESVAKSGHLQQRLGPKGRLSRVSWDEFGAYDVMFQTGKEPHSVSHWVGSPDGFVMVVASGSGEDAVYVFVTIY